MPRGKLFNSEENIAISLRPKEKFARGDVMRDRRTGKYDSRFKTIDPGREGGLRLGVGKLKKDVAKKSPGGATTRTQRYLVEQKDFEIKNKKLIPKTKRGKRELENITKKHGELLHLGEEQFITQRNKKEFKELSYFKNNPGGMYKANKLNEGSEQKLKKLNIPESTKRKMRTGRELTNIENEILHSQGFEYVRSSKRKSFLREYIGKTETKMNNLRLANIKRGII